MSSVSVKGVKSGVGAGCLMLFGLPFAGFGLFAAFKCVQEIAADNLKSGLFLLLFAVVFCGVGFGLMVFARWGAKFGRRQDRLKELQPNEPWRWREDWARGEVKSSAKGLLVFVWIFAFFWNAISAGAAFAALNEQRKSPALLLAGIFPLIGVGLLVWAIRQTIRWRRFGESTLKLNTVPGVIGGTLAGMIHTTQSMQDAEDIRLRLTCVERDRSGENTSERLRWEDEKHLLPTALQTGGIPVLFHIPFDCQPTATLPSTDSIVWQLEAQAKLPGADYQAHFEVPVFKTAASRADAVEAAKIPGPHEAEIESSPPGVSIFAVNDGSTQFNFAAARNRSVAFSLTLFTAIWTGAIVLMLKFHAPILFPIVFGLFEVLLLWGVVSTWTAASSVVANRKGLNVTRWWCFVRRERFLSVTDVQSIEPKLVMSSGSTTYYDLRAITNAGKKVKLASSIRGKRESEWLVREILAALGK
jgi:hypothetical protein